MIFLSSDGVARDTRFRHNLQPDAPGLQTPKRVQSGAGIRAEHPAAWFLLKNDDCSQPTMRRKAGGGWKDSRQ